MTWHARHPTNSMIVSHDEIRAMSEFAVFQLKDVRLAEVFVATLLNLLAFSPLGIRVCEGGAFMDAIYNIPAKSTWVGSDSGSGTK